MRFFCGNSKNILKLFCVVVGVVCFEVVVVVVVAVVGEGGLLLCRWRWLGDLDI